MVSQLEQRYDYLFTDPTFQIYYIKNVPLNEVTEDWIKGEYTLTESEK